MRPILGIVVLLSSVAAAPASPKPSGEGGANRPPTVRALCEPCAVPVGKTATVTAEARDPEGKRLTYTWKAPAGSLKKASDRQTTWTAPMVEGPVPVIVRVADGKGAIASDVIIIQVIKP
jgi:hypothetical protein